MASVAVAAPPSARARMPSTATSAPGIFRSASIARTRSRRLSAAAITRPPRRRPAATASARRRRPADAPSRRACRRRGGGTAVPPGDAGRCARRARSGPPAAPRRAVHAHVGGALEPVRRLRVEVGAVHELAAVEEALAQMADRPFHLPLVCARYAPHDRATNPSVPRSAGTPRSEPVRLRPCGRPTALPRASGRTPVPPAPRRSARTRSPDPRSGPPWSGADRTAATAAANGPAPPAARGDDPTEA